METNEKYTTKRLSFPIKSFQVKFLLKPILEKHRDFFKQMYHIPEDAVTGEIGWKVLFSYKYYETVQVKYIIIPNVFLTSAYDNNTE